MTDVSLNVLTPGSPDLERHAANLAGLTAGEVRFGRHDRMLYATDASIYQVEPLGVVTPRHVHEVGAIVDYCREHSIPLLPRGGGTSLAGQCTGVAVVLDLSKHLTQIRGISADSRLCDVDAGVTIDDLNDGLRAHGLFFAPDPATARHATIAGCIGNNAAGTRSIRYGRTSESIEAVSVVLASGEHARFARGAASNAPLEEMRSRAATSDRPEAERAMAQSITAQVIDVVQRHEPLIRERFPKTLRRNAGYALDTILNQIDEARRTGVDPLDTVDVAQLMCGSEGTLAVVTGATLKLRPVPEAKGLAVLGFDSLEAAIAAVVPLLALEPSAMELLDDIVMDLAQHNNVTKRFVELMPALRDGDPPVAVLYVEFFSESGREEIESKFSELTSLASTWGPPPSIACLADPVQIAQALQLRKAAEPLVHGIPGTRKPLGFVEDNAVPVEHLSEFVREFRRIVEKHGTRASFYAHASVGVLHVRPLLDLRAASDRTAMERIAEEIADLAKSLGGVMSGEHGDGKARGPLLERFYGPELMQAFREIKRIFDPSNMLNPGNIIEPGSIESIHESARVRPHGEDLPSHNETPTYFEYEEDGGFLHAVERCNGAGVCRKHYGGTMCPSYMATRDERHTTRGRGNALRLAITGQLGESRHAASGQPTWNDAETLETLSLCLSCKACKSECPTNVDMSKYKAEYLAQSYRERLSIPLSVQVFSRVRSLNRLGSAFAPVSNWVAQSWPNRWLLEQALGVDRRRTPPAFAPSLMKRMKRRRTSDRPDAPTVVLFPDCFTTYNEPHIGIAMVEALEALGYRVVVPRDAACCGRAAMSQGHLEYAAHTAGQAAEHLARTVKQHDAVAIVAGEPSCVSAITDDWQTLRMPNARVTSEELAHLASMTCLPEEFIEESWGRHPVQPECRSRTDRAKRIVLHGHCHQKALTGMARTESILTRLAIADQIDVLDSGCCGMAGAFGYMQDHYRVSMEIGELSLFPAVREAGRDVIVAAPGTSCRHQVHDATGRQALHPIEIVADALAGT